MTAPALTERDVLSALAKRHVGTAWAFFEHVRNGTGMTFNRTADALAMSLWPSRGLELHGYEVKVSRADWLRELRAPHKAEESLFAYCDRWWIVAPPYAVTLDELPPTWGLLVLKSGRLVMSRAAPKLTPADVDRAFLASLLRRLHEQEMQPAAVQEAYERGLKEATDGRAGALDRATERVEELQRAISEFQEKSGVHINTWEAGRIGEAVEAVLHGKHKSIVGSVRYVRDHMLRIVAAADALLEEQAREEQARA